MSESSDSEGSGDDDEAERRRMPIDGMSQLYDPVRENANGHDAGDEDDES
jgi:hypothetical protein